MSMSTMEKVMVLKSVSIFADTSEEVLAEAAAYLEEIEVPSGAPVFRLGEVGDSMYIVIRGLVRCHIDQKILNDLGEREIFGELAVLDPEPRSATVTALEDTHLFRLGRDAFFELVADHVEVARGVFQVLCRRLRKATE